MNFDNASWSMRRFSIQPLSARSISLSQNVWISSPQMSNFTSNINPTKKDATPIKLETVTAVLTGIPKKYRAPNEIAAHTAPQIVGMGPYGSFSNSVMNLLCIALRALLEKKGAEGYGAS